MYHITRMAVLLAAAAAVMLPLAAAAGGSCERYPSIQIDGVFYSVDCLCVDGPYIRHQINGREVFTPIETSRQVCRNWLHERDGDTVCQSRQTEPYRYPLSYTVEIYRVSVENEVLVGTRTFQLPPCSP